MFQVYYKTDRFCENAINVYSIKNDSSGRVLFLIYERGDWIHRHASFFKPFNGLYMEERF